MGQPLTKSPRIDYRYTGIAIGAVCSENPLAFYIAAESMIGAQNKMTRVGKMAGNTDNNERDKRRDAVNAIRLMCLDLESAASASKTFNLYPCDVAAARKVLEKWPHYRADGTTEHQRVEYLLNAGWRKRRRPNS